MKPPILHLVEPEPDDLSGLSYVSVPLRIRAKAQDIMSAAKALERTCSGSFTTEAKLAAAKDLIGKWRG